MIDRVIFHRHGAVPAFVADFKAEIQDVLFADLQIVRDFLSAHDFAVAAFVQRQIGVNQILVILQQAIRRR